MIEEMLKQQRLLDQLGGKSAIDEMLKQQRLMDRLGGNSVIEEAMRLANPGREMYDRLTKYDSAIREAAERQSGLFSARRWIEDLERAKWMNPFASDSAVRSLIEAQQLVGHSAVASVIEGLDNAALRLAREWSGESVIAREVEKTREMLRQPEWAFLTDQTIRALQDNYLGLFDQDSIYRDLLERMQAGLPKAGSAEEEADGYVEIIKTYVESALKRMKHWGLAEKIAIIEILVAIVFHYQQVQWQARVDAKLSNIENRVAAIEEAEAHAAAVGEAFTRKMEEAFANLMEQHDAAAVVKWAASERPVKVYSKPRGDGKLIGAILPFQVVTEIEHDGKWLRVEFQDHKVGVARVGWTMKKHLERITPPRTARNGPRD